MGDWDVVKSTQDPWAVVSTQPQKEASFSDYAQVLPMAAKAIGSGMIDSANRIGNVILPKKGQIPEIAGMTAADMATKAFSPAVGIAAGALGAGAGELGKQYYQAYQGEGYPKTAGEALKRLGGAAARGAVGSTIGKGLEFLSAPAAEGITPEIQTQIAAAKRIGVEPPLSSTTQSPYVQGMERMVESGPYGGAVTARKQAALQQLKDFTDSVSGNLGTKSTPEEATQTAVNKLKAYESVIDSTKDKLYDAVWPALKDQKPELTNTVSTLQNIIERKSGELEPAQLSMLKGLLERIKGVPETTMQKAEGIPAIGVNPTMETIAGKEGTIQTMQALRNTRSNIGQMIKEGFNDPALTGIKTDLKGLYGAISNDMDATASNVSPEIADGLTKANAAYKAGIEKLKQPIITALENRSKYNPNNLFDVVIKDNNPTLIKAGKDILGDDGFNLVRKQWFDNLVAKSTKIVEGNEELSPIALANNLKKVGSSLPEIVGNDSELGQKLSDLSDVSKMLTRGKKVTQGSQTAFIARTLKEVRDIFLAPLVNSETGREYLTTGFPGLGRSLGAAGAIESNRALQRATQ